MSSVAVCICGQGAVCPGDCAGVLMARSVCEARGHLTAAGIHERAWGEQAPAWMGRVCFRCNEEGVGDA